MWICLNTNSHLNSYLEPCSLYLVALKPWNVKSHQQQESRRPLEWGQQLCPLLHLLWAHQGREVVLVITKCWLQTRLPSEGRSPLSGECVGFWKPLGEFYTLCPVLPRAALNPALSGRTHYWSIIYFPERHFGDLAVMPSLVAWCSATSWTWVNHTANSVWKHSTRYFRRLKNPHMARVRSLKSFKFPMSLLLAGGGCA